MYDKKVLGFKEAEVAVQAMFEESSKKDPDRPTAVAVVDERGDIIMLARMDGARSLLNDMAFKKAYTAAMMRCDNRKYLEMKQSQEWGQHEAVFPGMSVIPGGVAVIEPGGTVVYGGIGVSGKSPADVDEAIALVGLKALQNFLWPSK